MSALGNESFNLKPTRSWLSNHILPHEHLSMKYFQYSKHSVESDQSKFSNTHFFQMGA